MGISIIIPTKNRKEDLLITLGSIIQQSRLPEEIVIIDQSQKNYEGEILGLFSGVKLDLTYVWDRDITSLVEARTTGFNKSKCEIVFFLDDDITLEKDYIKNLLQSYNANPQLGGIGGVDTSMGNRNPLWLLGKSLFTCGPFSLKKGGWFFTGWMAHYFHSRLTAPYPSMWLIGGMMSFRRHVVEEIGFDKQLVGHVFMDDIDFTFRASKKYPLAIDPRVKGYHRGGMVALYNMREDHERRVSGEWYFFRKNIKGTPLNILFFGWRIVGSLLVALTASFLHNSLDPLRGFLAGVRIGATRYRRAFPNRGILK